ncbi:hypothetical protein PV08_02294 [Exophiala spinifera]|uniref:Transcription factor domain-containing protein n=1 Tax=Exophiala spinifera TaxID=91928 RepID=A0A0D1ZZC6_9EURO|nr:uncharacterized protein PV08_02294 [Exophiala spinifera]KIW18007.1 hypothetical protein PV08_02294 [Exophiala spinifera]
MTTSRPTIFRFVPQRPQRRQTQREHELEIANRRSHAATVTHMRKASLHLRYVPPGETRSGRAEKPILLNPESSALYPKKPTSVTGGHASVWQLLASLPEMEDEDEVVDLDSLVEVLSRGEPISTAPGGNSDAFNCYAISITSRINQVLAFARDVGIPGLFFTPFFHRISHPIAQPTVVKSSSILSSPSAVLNWELTSAALTDQGAALALVSSHVVVMCLFLPPPAARLFREIAMRMMSHSMLLLRNEIARFPATQGAPYKASKFLILQMYWLYRAESTARNFAAAAIHEKMLYRFIAELNDEDVDFKYYMYLCMMFWAVDTTIMTMKRDSYDPRPHGSKIIARLQRLAAPDLEYLPADYKYPDCIINHEPLRSVLVRSRRLATLMSNPLPAEVCADPIKRFNVSYFCVIQNFLDTLTLMDSYFDTTDGGNPFSLPTGGQKYLYAGACLTIVLVSRSLIDVTSINGVNLREASHIILPHLRRICELVRLTMTPFERTLFQELRLWIFYIGTLYEQRLLLKRVDPVETWFGDMLAIEASASQTVDWQSMKQILQKFLFSEFMEPHGEFWFESWLKSKNM